MSSKRQHPKRRRPRSYAKLNTRIFRVLECVKQRFNKYKPNDRHKEAR